MQQDYRRGRPLDPANFAANSPAGAVMLPPARDGVTIEQIQVMFPVKCPATYRWHFPDTGWSRGFKPVPDGILKAPPAADAIEWKTALRRGEVIQVAFPRGGAEAEHCWTFLDRNGDWIPARHGELLEAPAAATGCEWRASQAK